jgi:hypothetical protein
MKTLPAVIESCQQAPEGYCSESGRARADRRLLLPASLRLLLYRVQQSIPVPRADLLRLLDLADEPKEIEK